ncbi:hypothetical protein FACS1894172_15250 [Spirochaetia bacterium]|nr:hypothetical protein FACS1894164_04060 [Spirochaetia bacterium]GHU34660.1 hypothetical protein FACS1894172_15250 [Spirochaetia bacterium]
MKIRIKGQNEFKEPAQAHHIKSGTTIQRYGAWGVVKTVHSNDISVDVLIDGVLVLRVPVASQEWVKAYQENEEEEDSEVLYVSGDRHLPPVGARVFVLMPTGNFDGCFVLCSGFSIHESSHRTTFALEGDDDPEIAQRKNTALDNWKTVRDYEKGNITIYSPDDKTFFRIEYPDESGEPENPEIHLQAFEEVKLDIVQDNNTSLSLYDEVSIKHKKDTSTVISSFDEVLLQHTKEKAVDIQAFDEVVISHTKGESVTIVAFDTLIMIDKDGVLSVNGNSEIKAKSPEAITMEGRTLTVTGKDNATVKGGNSTVTVKDNLVTINGETYCLVQWETLDAAMRTFWMQLKVALSISPIAGNGAVASWIGLPSSIDLSNAKAQPVKIGGPTVNIPEVADPDDIIAQIMKDRATARSAAASASSYADQAQAAADRALRAAQLSGNADAMQVAGQAQTAAGQARAAADQAQVASDSAAKGGQAAAAAGAAAAQSASSTAQSQAQLAEQYAEQAEEFPPLIPPGGN